MLKVILEFISSIAWPLLVFFIFIYLKNPLKKSLEDLKLQKFTYKDLSFDFSNGVSDLKFKLDESKSGNVYPKVEPNSYSNITEVAKLSPSSSILLSWNLVENEISKVIRDLAISPDYPAYNSTLKNVQLLKNYTNIDDKTIEILNDFRLLRNTAVHYDNSSKAISYDDAIQYYFVANSLISRLQNIKKV